MHPYKVDVKIAGDFIGEVGVGVRQRGSTKVRPLLPLVKTQRYDRQQHT